jgi:lipid-A-disaccharide synthase
MNATALAVTGTAPSIMIAAGEASGDLHGATLCRALREAAPAAQIFGMGSARMAAAGVDVLEDVTPHAAVGGTEAAGGVLALYRTYRRLRARLDGPGRPHALVLVDFPEFNLRLARAARRRGVPVVYFVPPQIWAWRPWRVRAMRRVLSLVVAVFPFEPPLYRTAGVPVVYVGHPVVDLLAAAPARGAVRARLDLGASVPVLALLPGSRRAEIERVLPTMRDAIARVRASRPGVRVLVARAPGVDAALIARHVPGALITDGAYDAIRAADVALATSGTVTLEAALLGTPTVACYRVSRASAVMIRSLTRVPWMSLANIVLGREVIPELFQEALTSERLACEAERLLDDGHARAAQQVAFRELAEALGAPGVGSRAAQAVLAVARESS